MFTLTKKDPAKQLRVIMAERDINVNELAYKTGLSQRTITDLRNNSSRRPNRDTIYLICDALNVRPNKIWPDV